MFLSYVKLIVKVSFQFIEMKGNFKYQLWFENLLLVFSELFTLFTCSDDNYTTNGRPIYRQGHSAHILSRSLSSLTVLSDMDRNL